MTTTDYKKIFEEKEAQSSISKAGGVLAVWLLHFGKVAFLIYSATHTINASLTYAGSSTPAKIAQVVGIVVVEMILFSLYLAYVNQKITGSGQMIASGITYAVGFSLACLGIIADSQFNGGRELSTFMVQYLTIGLPVSPAVMALGAVSVHLLDPKQLRSNKEARQANVLASDKFDAELANQRLDMEGDLSIKALQVMGKQAVLRELGKVYESPEFAQAVQQAAISKAPALFAQAGISLDGQSITLEDVTPKLDDKSKQNGKAEKPFLA